ncbi:MAG: TRAM domain-containing protein [bacterium]
MARNTTPSAGRPAAGTRLAVQIASVGAGAMGVARHDGFTLLVPRGLAGEQVEVVVEKLHPRYAVARREKVLRSADDQAQPRCDHFARCRGCDWQHLAYPSQLARKRQVLEDQLHRIGGLIPPAGWQITPSETPYEYRDKLEFALIHQDGGARAAFHGQPGAPFVAIDRCHLAPPEFSEAANAAARIFSHRPAPDPASDPASDLETPPAGGAGGGRTVPAQPLRITVQAATAPGEPERSGMALTIHFAEIPAWLREAQARRRALAQLAAAAPSLITVALAAGGKKKGGAALDVLKGSPVLGKVVGEWHYLVPLLHFFQVHPRQAALMVTAVRDALQEGLAEARQGAPLVMDLFCGVGLFSLPLAAAGFRLAGVEKEREAVRAARESARAANVAGCAFQAADLARPGVLADLVRRHGPPAGILVNPPRAGLPAPLTAALLRLAPQRLVYVSCDGGTFARDAKRLAPRYQLTALRGFDLFPQTHHLETLAVFTPRQG